MRNAPHWLDKVIDLLQADTSDLRELARLAGGNPKTFYRGINVNEVDLSGQNIDGMDFSSLPLPANEISAPQLSFEFNHPDEYLAPDQVAQRIKTKSRQEERAALLLAEFLRNRLYGTKVIKAYNRDKAALTNSVIQTLREIRETEVRGKQYSELQIARKVSGRFAKSEDKRSVLAYYLGKHLNQYPTIRIWLRTKSVAKLSYDQRRELSAYLRDTE